MLLNGASILIIGASHLAYPGTLATTLNDALLDKGAQVHSLGVCGITPSQWTLTAKGSCGAAERIGTGPLKLKIGSKAETVPIRKLVETEKPALLIIVMGDTLADYRNAAGMSLPWAGAEIDKVAKEVSLSGVRCAWVGPSWGEEGFSTGKTYARVQQVSRLLSNKVAPCVYIDSLKMSKPGEWSTLDGIHYRDRYYKQWGDKIVEELEKLD